jgi:two-component system, chemotaxis family, sensor kinase Cph1
MSGFAPDPIPPDHLSQAGSEPVNFANSIQPHGVLLGLSDPGLIVLQVSANVQDYFDSSPQELLGQPLRRLLSEPAIALIQQASTQPDQTALQIEQNHQTFNGILYRSAGLIILELEPLGPLPNSIQLHRQVKQAVVRLRQVSDLTEFLQLAALEVRQLTQFSRVLVYQFDAEGAGEVVAEAKQADLPTYLGLHYPATDIPEPVRALYRLGLLRYIPDLEAPAVALISSQNSLPQPDLSFSTLRSVDACCVEYHRNMNVAAILILALVQGERLWGLISCHHPTPQPLAYEVREGCDLLAQFIASELANKVSSEELSNLTKLRSLQSEFIQSISQADDLKQALVHPAPRLLDLVGAQGAAICMDEITLVGVTPTLEQVEALLKWTETSLPVVPADRQIAPALFHTDSLPKLYPPAAAFKDRASGLLVLQISQVRRYTILWFRPEVLQTVNWAGDPNSALTVAADGVVTLCPRQSFEQWQQTVQMTCLPWKASELESALDLRSAIVGIVLKKADELARVNQELERSVRELDSFAYAASHDLKEPLRGIHNFSNLLLKGYADVLDEVGQTRLRTLIRLTRRMESLIDALLKFSRLGQTDLYLQPIDLNQALQQVLEDLRVSHADLSTEVRIPRPLPMVDCDPILIQEVLTNLISNAIKYNDKPERWVEVGYRGPAEAPPEQQPEQQPEGIGGRIMEQPRHQITLYVRDNGIGIRERHLNSVFRLFKRLHEQHLYGGGTGAGLTIAKKIIERHGGDLWLESSYGQGSTFYFTL